MRRNWTSTKQKASYEVCGSLRRGSTKQRLVYVPGTWTSLIFAQAIHALDQGEVYEAYELYLLAGMYTAAHDLAVMELAPDAIIRKDLELLQELFDRISGHPVDGWHSRGKVSGLFFSSY